MGITKLQQQYENTIRENQRLQTENKELKKEIEGLIAIIKKTAEGKIKLSKP